MEPLAAIYGAQLEADGHGRAATHAEAASAFLSFLGPARDEVLADPRRAVLAASAYRSGLATDGAEAPVLRRLAGQLQAFLRWTGLEGLSLPDGVPRAIGSRPLSDDEVRALAAPRSSSAWSERLRKGCRCHLAIPHRPDGRGAAGGLVVANRPAKAFVRRATVVAECTA